jgi:hypothetical protein
MAPDLLLTRLVLPFRKFHIARLLRKKAGKITQVPHLVSHTRTHGVQPTC